MAAFKNLEGQRFGRLFVLEPVENFGGMRKWRCVCDCGAIVEVRGAHMSAGRSKSCGCLNAEMASARAKTHGQSHLTPEYRTWCHIRARCNDPKDISYKYYGAKGIKVCEHWSKFENFFSDMGKRPSTDHSIDRKDNLGDYSKDNCRWATEVEQQNNKSSNVFIEYAGKRLTISQWDRELGHKRCFIRGRIQNGWTPLEAVSTPRLK